MSGELSPEVLGLVNEGLPRVRIPGPTDRVYKDECIYTFDTPVRPVQIFHIYFTRHFSKSFVIYSMLFKFYFILFLVLRFSRRSLRPVFSFASVRLWVLVEIKLRVITREQAIPCFFTIDGLRKRYSPYECLSPVLKYE